MTPRLDRAALLGTIAGLAIAGADPGEADDFVRAPASEPEPMEMERVVVESKRLPPWVVEGSYAIDVVDPSAAAVRARQNLDDVLRSTPGFRLFRRSSSSIAHPTAQGVSLRNTGASGASRTLVLVDGMPRNDPFGGWVPWTAIPGGSIERVTLVRDGGLSPFGQATMGGLIAIDSLLQRQESLLRIEARAGEALDSDGLAIGTWAAAEGTTLGGAYRHADYPGFPVIAAAQRGSIDTDAGYRIDWGRGVVRQVIGDGWEAGVQVEGFRENRSNGTPQAVNRTEGTDWSLALRRPRPGTSGPPLAEVFIYGQDREFSNVFTAVDDARTRETPVLDQFSVPSEAIGGGIRMTLDADGIHDVRLGIDGRWVQGFTNEDFRNLGNGFTRRRRAGGEQWQAGAWVLDTVEVHPDVHINLGARIDHLGRTGASRRETDLIDGSTVLDVRVPDSDRFEESLRAGIIWAATDALALRASAFTSAREPTLNELYRPFRVGNDITEANSGLDAERLRGIDAGFAWIAETRTIGELTLEGSAFLNRIDDAVANVTLAEGPAVVPPWGFIPAGGTGQQRRNVEHIDLAGFEIAATWKPIEHLAVRATYLWTEAETSGGRGQSSLDGKRPAQTPEHQASLAVEISPTDRLTAGAELRYVGEQFEDDLNTIQLADALVVDLFVGWEIGRQWSIVAGLENAFDETIETRKTSDGLTYVGNPRLWTLGARYTF